LTWNLVAAVTRAPEIGCEVHSAVRDANNEDVIVAHTVEDDVAALGEAAQSLPDLVARHTQEKVLGKPPAALSQRGYIPDGLAIAPRLDSVFGDVLQVPEGSATIPKLTSHVA
jgi:hypothetical protein